jgi:hypothetical protein
MESLNVQVASRAVTVGDARRWVFLREEERHQVMVQGRIEVHIILCQSITLRARMLLHTFLLTTLPVRTHRSSVYTLIRNCYKLSIKFLLISYQQGVFVINQLLIAKCL